MLNSRTARIIISILASILLWAYVIGEVNPDKEKTIRNVPIIYTYVDTLNERGLAIAGAEDESVSVEVIGSRALLGSITSNDISATINVASAQRGENEMSISIRVPSGITVSNQSITRTQVTVENMVQKPVEVEIEYTGDFAPSDSGSTVAMSSSQVVVTGAESLVENVVSAKGTIEATLLSDSLTAIQCQLEPVDEAGNIVDGVRLAQKTLSVTAVLARIKEVELDVSVKDAGSEEYIREVDIPESISIYGNANMLENINKITAEEVDISGITQDKEIELKLNLPDGISIPEGEEEPTIKVNVSPVASKEFIFTGEEISIEGGNQEMTYTLPENLEIKVTVKDKEGILNGISKNGISLKLDVSKLENSGDVKIDVVGSRELFGIIIEPENVTVQVEAVSKDNE